MIRLNRPPCPYPKALADNNYKHTTNKDALRKGAHDKCMYCESIISHISYAHVEHIKPKADGKYPELEFEWSNLGYACAMCNGSKSDKYDENTPFIDPYIDNPNDYIFALGPMLFQRNGSERGEYTIKEIALNRLELVEKRNDKTNNIMMALNACYRTDNKELRESAIMELQAKSDTDQEYSLCVQSVFIANDYHRQ